MCLMIRRLNDNFTNECVFRQRSTCILQSCFDITLNVDSLLSFSFSPVPLHALLPHLNSQYHSLASSPNLRAHTCVALVSIRMAAEIEELIQVVRFILLPVKQARQKK